MTIRLGCIADDFTGATDLAGLLARSGLPVSLRIGTPEKTTDLAPFEVIALKIRTNPVEDAVAQSLQALDWLRAGGAAQIFWKYCSTFDSTAQGNIGPVSEALMDALGTDQTIYCPAFPENGRSIFMGNLFMGEDPLAESPMKDHPLTPMRDSNLMRLLAPQVSKPVGLANRLTVAAGAQALRDRLADLKAQGVAHVITDAVANDDLHIIAEACRDMPLLTGGSAVAMPLPALFQQDGTLENAAPFKAPQIDNTPVILSGSCSAMTNAQVAAFTGEKHRLDPLDIAENGPQAAIEWLLQQPTGMPKLLYATADPASVKAAQAKLGTAAAGQLIEDTLATLAQEALKTGHRRFIVAGGETSGAVTQALQVSRLAIGPEIAPGVPWTFAASAGHPIALTLKSGNFGAETFFQDALEAL
ncbi:3-oxo-tetronate kinase [Cognatishimia sp. MH4019]|uniref:3-oxo-tetronate kinase n=1 Tax=Cognatishimia sp. MH4019 TaxID=2854030 RepID=UPI001CD79602|nr:3-oxo-tetronate kinase [Cognatishimia sp. MH4019]